MEFKKKFSELPLQACFVQKNKTKKKIQERKAAIVREKDGKVLKRKVKGDPVVEEIPCPINYLGVGLRRHPDQIVEIGDGNPLRNRKRKKN